VVSFFTSRIENLRNFLKTVNISNLLILSDENIFYLTGFYGKGSNSLFFITDKDLYLLTNFLYIEDAKQSVIDGINIIRYQKGRFKKFGELLEGFDFKYIYTESKNISFQDAIRLKEVLSGQGKKLKIKDGLVESLRVIKDKYEISKIKKACVITDNAFQDILESGVKLFKNLSEIELAFHIEKLMVKNKASGKSFDIITAYDKNSSMPHYSPQEIKLKYGKVLMDFGCRYKNYCSDMTRTIFVKNNKISNEFKKIYDIVLEAQLQSISSCRAGIECNRLDSVARKYISSRGYGDNFGHGLGHGVGLEIHEEPVINAASKTVLRENMVITIEPGIYIENFGGVRIEDILIVKKNGCEVLYNSRKDFFIMEK
jgi:Xaa-Pro aminopeptidase